MPFASKKQWKACFVSGGFGGKVDCKKWAKKTKKNYRELPEKVSEAREIQNFKQWLSTEESS